MTIRHASREPNRLKLLPNPPADKNLLATTALLWERRNTSDVQTLEPRSDPSGRPISYPNPLSGELPNPIGATECAQSA